MLIINLALAMILGGIAATATLTMGWSLLAALAVYSGTGVIGILIFSLCIIMISEQQHHRSGCKSARNDSRPQTDISAYN